MSGGQRNRVLEPGRAWQEVSQHQFYSLGRGCHLQAAATS